MKKIMMFLILFSVLSAFSEEVVVLKQKAEQGDVEAQHDLGVSYYFGEGVEKNPNEAVKWWQKAAEQGNAKSQNNLGVCYQEGSGVEKNIQEALKWYRKSAEQGNKKGQDLFDKCANMIKD